MKATFRAKFLPLLAQFAGKRDIRYYLNGFHVEPAHPSLGGVFLTATDGHTLIVIHDQHGTADDSGIWPIPAGLITKCKRAKDDLVGSERTIEVDSDTETMWIIKNLGREKVIGVGAKMIDSKYPDVYKLMPKFDELAPVDGLVVNPDYLARISKCLKALPGTIGRPHIKLRAKDATNVIWAMTYNVDEDRVMFGIMPMRDDGKYVEHEWMSVKRDKQRDVACAKRLFQAIASAVSTEAQ